MSSSEQRRHDAGAEAKPVGRLEIVEAPASESAPESAWPEVDRRKGGDRRAQSTRPWDAVLGFTRRKRGRRKGEAQNAYVDVFTGGDIALILAIFVINILDAFLTLVWLRMGGRESNPLMDFLIQSNETIFLIEKCGIVGVWLIVLITHKNFRIARWGLWGAFFLYTGILLYHMFLQLAGAPPPLTPEISIVR